MERPDKKVGFSDSVITFRHGLVQMHHVCGSDAHIIIITLSGVRVCAWLDKAIRKNPWGGRSKESL